MPAEFPPNLLPLVVSVGDPAGIGIDIILQIWAEKTAESTEISVPNFLLVCDPDHLEKRAEQLGLAVDYEVVDPDLQLPWTISQNILPIIALEHKLAGVPSAPNPADADGIVESIARAVELVQTGRARAVVTLPINKKSLYDSGFDFPGHTEFLGSLASQWDGVNIPVKPVMMLAGPDLRAVPVTIHIPLKDVPSALTSDNIVDTVRIAARDLTSRFSIAKPRIAISGLNPHAGEEGAMGSEDAEIIAPAIAQLQLKGIDCFGPLPADTMFHALARKKYDLAVCMYHDQALIPAKALAFDETVNVTLGLPFVRTSPDHGTAYDLAGTGKANPASTLAALRMADEMSRTVPNVDQSA